MTPPKPAAERPATFGDVFAVPEYRALFAASAMSWIGDNLARAAATALVFSVTDSVVLSAASFAISYLPSVTFGPLLAALAERYPHRKVMITCDVVRAVLISLVAIPHLPVPAILVLLFATALLSPAFDASRSALLPRILEGDRYVVGLSMNATTANIAMIFGYVVGGAIAPFHPHAAMLVDAATFLGSGAILTTWIQPRSVIASAAQRRRLVTETVAGFRLVLRSPVLRAIAAVVFFGAMFVVVPEGLAAAWASELSHQGGDRGFDQAFIMTASPVGAVIGAIVVGRLVSPATRQRLLRPLAVLVPAALVPVFLTHSVAVIGMLVAHLVVRRRRPDRSRERAVRPGAAGRVPSPRVRRHAGRAGALSRSRPARRRLHRLSRRGVDRGHDLQRDRCLRHDRDQRPLAVAGAGR